jgi:Uma2 family endonuclease
MSTVTKPITADELFAMGNIGRCELLYGELVMMSPAGAEHGVVAVRFCRFLAAFVEDERLGVVFASETGFELANDLVRAADAAFVAQSRLTHGIPKGFFPGAPDLAVEVISPGDRKREIADKINTWLANGTKVVWEADPKTAGVRIHRVGQKPLWIDAKDSIRDEPLLPGFVLPLEKIFRLP